MMRVRCAVIASLVGALAVVAVPAVASARHRHASFRLTINAIPNPIIAGEGVLVYGQLKGSDVAGQTIRLYHHIAGGPPGYSFVQSTTTDSFGFYEFTRADGVVETNRSWFVAGPGASRSRAVQERVAALVSIHASTTSAVTGQPVLFTGHVTPNHAFGRVLLQEHSGAGDNWRTLRIAPIGPGSDYAVSYSWRTPGEHDVRVLLPADARNIRSESGAVGVTVQQRQVSGFTITSSDPLAPYAHPVTISGVLTPGPTAMPTTVQLWARPAHGGPFRLIATAPIGASGTYRFTEMPPVNTVYQARTPFGAVRASAKLWQGVRDLITLTASANSSTVGGTVTLSGLVVPDKAGHLVYLQRLGADGDWHNVDVQPARFDSTFSFAWTFGQPGTYEFRARIYSDGRNVGAFSTPPVTVTVTGAAPPSTLPPAG